MIQISITLDDVDFDGLIDQYLPFLLEKLKNGDGPGSLLSAGVPAGLARSALHRLPQDKKERLAAELINKNSDRLAEKIEDLARENGVGIKIGGITARR